MSNTQTSSRLTGFLVFLSASTDYRIAEAQIFSGEARSKPKKTSMITAFLDYSRFFESLQVFWIKSTFQSNFFQLFLK